MLKRRIKVILLLLGVLYIAGILFVPFMKPLRYNWFAWFLFIIYILNVIFVFGFFSKKEKLYKGTWQEKEDMAMSRELLKNRNKWFV